MGNIVYICEPNCVLHRSGKTIVVRKHKQIVSVIPVIDIDVIVVLGNIQITTQALNMIFDNTIDVIFMKNNGFISGRINSSRANNVILRLAQYKKYNDPQKKLVISKNIILSKINKQIALLNSINSKNKYDLVSDNVKLMKKYKAGIQNADSSSGIMGVEGICAKKYFDCFRVIIRNSDFSERQRRPAHEPVNATLNLGYAFLRNEINTRLNIYGFDLELGFLHGIRYGRESLSLDLMEEFRPMVIDKLVINMFNKKQLKSEDFITDENGCILTNEGMKKFINMYNIHIQRGNKGTSFDKLFNSQVQKFRKAIMSGSDYTAYDL